MKSTIPGYKGRTKNREAISQTGSVLPGAAYDYRRHVLAILALSAITLLAFSNSFQAGFILDNRRILLDPRIQDATRENIALIFRHTYWWPAGESGLYRPFTTLSYLFNYAVLGNREATAGYHWINLILHLTNVWLTYALALRLTRKFWSSVLMAGLWAVHPVTTESVTNIAGRADLLAAGAVLSGLLLYLKSVESRGWSRALYLAALSIVSTIGVFSKESAVAILPLIILYELVWRRQRPRWWAAVVGGLAVLLPIAAMLYQRSIVLAASAPAEFPFVDNPIVGAGWWTGRVTAANVLIRYLWLTIWPAKLSSDYSYNQIPLASGAAADWLACGMALGATIVAVLLYRKRRTCFFLACFAFLSLLPASNLLFPVGTIMADRLLYLPSFGLLGCLVLAIDDLARGHRTATVVSLLACVMISGFAVRTWLRNRDWRSELEIAVADVRVSPNSFKVHRLLATSLFEADPSHSNIDRVIAEIEKSAAVVDSLPIAFRPSEVYRLAGYYCLVKSHQVGEAKNGPFDKKAIQYLLRSISADKVGRATYRTHHRLSGIPSGDPESYLFLAAAYLESGNPDEALEAANQARALDRLNPKVYRQLSAVFTAQGHDQEAEIATTLADAVTSLQSRNWADAAELSDHVMRFEHGEYSAAYNVNAIANLRLGNLDAAENTAREAMRLDDEHQNPEAGYILGLVLAKKQDFKQAAELLSAYLNTTPNAPDAEIVRGQLRQIESLGRAGSSR